MIGVKMLNMIGVEMLNMIGVEMLNMIGVEMNMVGVEMLNMIGTHVRALGCRVKTESSSKDSLTKVTTSSAVLAIPLVFPTPSKGRKKKS
ncbi:hypothetical protein ACOMHN_009410 [Nucella lapillus]